MSAVRPGSSVPVSSETGCRSPTFGLRGLPYRIFAVALFLPGLLLAQTKPPGAVPPLKISAPQTLKVRSGKVEARADLKPAQTGNVNLVLRALPRPAGEAPDFITVILQNEGEGTAKLIRVRVSGSGLCPQGSGCDAPTRAFLGSCWEGDCKPCDVTPEPGGNGVGIRCEDSLAPGEHYEMSLQPSFANPPAAPGPASPCEGSKKILLEARSEQPDADAKDNQATVELPASPRVRAVRFYPADGPLEPSRAISSILMGQPFRVAIELGDAMCPESRVEVAFERSDGTYKSFKTVKPLSDNSRLAVEDVVTFARVFWPGLSLSEGLKAPVDATLDRPLGPRPGDEIQASCGEKSATLRLADPADLFVTLSLVAPGPNGAPRPDRRVRQGESYRIRLLVNPESPLAKEKYLHVLLRHTLGGDPSLSALRAARVDRIDAGRYESDRIYVFERPGIRIDASFAHAMPPSSPDHRLLVAERAGEIEIFEPSSGWPVTWRRASARIHIGGVVEVQVTPPKGASIPPPEVVVSIERRGRQVAQGRFATTSSAPGKPFRTKPFLLASGEKLGDVRAGDRAVLGVPTYDSVVQLEILGRTAYGPYFQAASGKNLREANPGDRVQLALGLQDPRNPESGTVADVSVRVRRRGSIAAEKVVRLFADSTRPELNRMISLARPDLGVDVIPGDVVEAEQVDRMPSPADESPVTVPSVPHSLVIVAPVPKLKSLSFETAANPGAGHRLGVPLSDSVKAVADFEVAPFDPPTIQFRVTRAGATILEFRRSAAPVSGTAGRFSTEPVAFASEPRREDLAAGDLLEARFEEAKWVSIPILGRAGFLRDLRVFPLDEENRAAAIVNEIPYFKEVVVEATFEEPPVEKEVTARVEVGPPPLKGAIRTSSYISSVRLVREAASNRYRGVVKPLEFQAGAALTVGYGAKTVRVLLTAGPQSPDEGRLQIVAENSVGHEESVPVTVFEAYALNGRVIQLFDRVESAFAPATLDLRLRHMEGHSFPLTHVVRFEYAPLAFTRVADVQAGKTVTVKATSPPMGRLIVDLQLADGSSVMPSSVRVIRREALEGWADGGEVTGKRLLELPAGLYDVIVNFPGDAGGTEIYQGIRMVAGREEILRVSFSGRVKVVLLDAAGKPVKERAITVGSFVGMPNEISQVPPGTHTARVEILGKSLTRSVTVVAGRETEADLGRLGRLRLEDTGADAETPYQWAGVNGSSSLRVGESLDVVPGTYTVEFGYDGDLPEVRTVEVAGGATVVVDRKALRGRLRLPLPDAATVAWRLDLEGVNVPHRFEYRLEPHGETRLVAPQRRYKTDPGKIVKEAGNKQKYEIDLTAGTYRALLQTQYKVGVSSRAVFRCDTRVVVTAGGSATLECPVGELEVAVRSRDGQPQPSRVFLTRGAQASGTNEELSSQVIFRVAEGNYTVRAEGVKEQHVTVFAGQKKTVTLQPAKDR